MATTNTIPDLDRRLVEDRGAMLCSVDALRLRMRRDLRELSPREILKRHAGAALTGAVVVAGVLGIASGRIARGLIRAILS